MNPKSAALVTLAMALNHAQPSPAQQSDANTTAAILHALFDERYQWTLNNFPDEARMRGDYRSADQITDVSLAAIERRHTETAAHLDRLHGIDRGALSPDDQLNYDLFELELRNAVEGHRFRMFLAPVGPRDGPHQEIPEMHVRSRF